jgi:hypothetical protein
VTIEPGDYSRSKTVQPAILLCKGLSRSMSSRHGVVWTSGGKPNPNWNLPSPT